MRRWLIVPFVLLVPLFATQAASTAVKEFGGTVTVAPTGPGEFTAVIQNTDIDNVLNTFTFVPGPKLKVTAVVRSDAGSCTMSGATFTCNSLGLAQATCFCQPGGTVNVTFSGTGDASFSSIAQVGSPGAMAAAAPAATGVVAPTTVANVQVATTKAVTKAAVAKKVVAKKKIALCKKGQKTTKKHPCRQK
jgi:hypothetical protein